MSGLSTREMGKIARKLVRDSMKIGGKPNRRCEAVRIMYNSTDETCVEFAYRVEEECWKVGAHTLFIPYNSRRQRRKFALTPGKALREMNPLGKAIVKTVDVTILIGEEDDPNWSQGLTSKVKLAAPNRQKLREILDRRKVRWVYFGWPVPGAALGYGCPVQEFRRIFFNSIRKSFGSEVRRLCEYYRAALVGGKEVEIEAEDGTELRFRISGRPVLVDDGVISLEDVARGDVGLNIPSGEVFIAPLETTANGRIFFENISIHGFGKLEGLWLQFKNGKVSSYEAARGEENFTKFLNANVGEKDRIAELGVGCNPGAEYTGGSIIIDEKIFGTLHIAIGNNTGSYHGKNKASSHLDMIKDMRTGELHVDGKTIMRGGKPVKG